MEELVVHMKVLLHDREKQKLLSRHRSNQSLPKPDKNPELHLLKSRAKYSRSDKPVELHLIQCFVK